MRSFSFQNLPFYFGFSKTRLRHTLRDAFRKKNHFLGINTSSYGLPLSSSDYSPIQLILVVSWVYFHSIQSPYPFILCNILNWLLSELIKHVSEMHLNIHFDCDISVIKINYLNWRQSMWIKIHHFEKKIIIMLKIQLCEENSIFWWKITIW